MYDFLDPDFLVAMDDIGRCDAATYGDRSFQARRLTGSRARDVRQVVGNRECAARFTAQALAARIRDHLDQYMARKQHDHFKDDMHQLAAVAFSAMAEAYFAGLTKPQNRASVLYAHEEGVTRLEGELMDLLSGFQWEDITYDAYDNSLEVYGVPSGYVLSTEQLRKLREFGFGTVYTHTQQLEEGAPADEELCYGPQGAVHRRITTEDGALGTWGVVKADHP